MLFRSRARGAARLCVAASHGVFSTKATECLAGAGFDEIVVTDSVPPFRLGAELRRDRLVVLDAAALFAAAIGRMHEGGSLVELLES